MAYIVTAGYVTVETCVPGGGRAHLDVPRGTILPADVPAEQVETLLRQGRIAPHVDGAEEADEPDPSTPEPGKRPRKNGSEAAWREWAVSHGMDPEQAADLTRDQLIELADQLDKEE